MTDKVANLGERRASKEGAQAWTPVELLRAFLLEIESGKVDVDRLVICFQSSTNGAGERLIGYRQAIPEPTITLGMLNETADLLLHPETCAHG